MLLGENHPIGKQNTDFIEPPRPCATRIDEVRHASPTAEVLAQGRILARGQGMAWTEEENRAGVLGHRGR